MGVLSFPISMPLEGLAVPVPVCGIYSSVIRKKVVRLNLKEILKENRLIQAMAGLNRQALGSSLKRETLIWVLSGENGYKAYSVGGKLKFFSR